MEEQDLKQIANCSSNIFSPHYSVLFLFFFKPWLLYLHKCPLARIAKSLIEASFYFQGSRRFLSFPGGVTSTSFIFCDGDFHRRHSSEIKKEDHDAKVMGNALSCLPLLGGGSSQAARAGLANLWALHILAGGLQWWYFPPCAVGVSLVAGSGDLLSSHGT